MSGEEENKENGKSFDSVENDFNAEKRIQHIKETLWQNKRVRYTLIAMGGLLMISYTVWVVTS